jgi:hypothetical protein
MTEQTSEPIDPFTIALAETIAELFALSGVTFEAGKVTTWVRNLEGDWREAYLVNLADGSEAGTVGKFTLASVADRAAKIAAERS